MKSFTLLLFLIISANILASAQNLKAGRFKTGSNTFDVKKVKNQFVVSNIKNSQVDKARKLPEHLVNSGYEQFLHIGEKERSGILSLVTAEYTRLGKQLPMENPLIVYYISEDGNILAMDFILLSDSRLTTDDFRIIEGALKGKFHFKTDSKKLSGAGYVTWASRLTMTKPPKE
ncbi:hypothetical protein LZD49_35150 [Dyadobacter sp. CY261]|uniref:hypothetical protein n=1 Tax=Dyadobacter sp. CY261 TaxID=2907203 RepID=UPI001F272BCA|nr:hypothetical protein [Dyadobacter sp. CY261]MCF0075761.1 hypothetical protein [Dyadobacter sp. CY261]